MLLYPGGNSRSQGKQIPVTKQSITPDFQGTQKISIYFHCHISIKCCIHCLIDNDNDLKLIKSLSYPVQDLYSFIKNLL